MPSNNRRRQMDLAGLVAPAFKGQNVNGSLRAGNAAGGWNKDWNFGSAAQVNEEGGWPRAEGPGPWTNANRTGE